MISTFLPRFSFSDADVYVLAARRGDLRVGQYVSLDGVDARFGGCRGGEGSHVTTWWWMTSTRTASGRRQFAIVSANNKRRVA